MCMSQNEFMQGVDIKKMAELSFCKGCLAGKMCFPQWERCDRHGNYSWCIVTCGPVQTQWIGGAKYFLAFIDDYTRCCTVFFMKRMSEVLGKFKEFKVSTTNYVGRVIGAL